MSAATLPNQEKGSYVGWVAAGIVLALVFAGSALVWFMFHPW